MKRTFLTICTLMMFALVVSPLMAHGQTLVVQLKGKAQGFLKNVPAADSGKIKDAMCFEVQMFDVPTGLQLGTALDCLSDVVSDGDGGVTLTDTTIFKFKRNGKLVSHGRVSIRPLQDTESAPASTHITGSVPSLGTKNIITRKGTKRFRGRTGVVRLSGAVNMSDFNGEPGTPIEFNCLFVIQLDGLPRA
ncbi:MAG: hypothetical protein NPIRA02_28380 [Nitrospirales bacterium]|nr:MAG: hypothetical protein NPIRA02_28380 [Nitrospirales bacterium]